ncbi:hypothetical protein GQ53DRAFT_714043 [Thozetella sp. PMI_491]|nr:hypothetical protein GQ53DRAFT_714043 [Thozetella sp. PMI_491]
MARKSRHGARGIRKVRTGCSTCKTRHKKCDEARPACSQCIRAGWKCDFVSSFSFEALQHTVTPPICSLGYPSARPLRGGEFEHMEYFRAVCAGEFSLFFELPAWENMLLQGTVAEPALHHAALAIGALTRSRYHPDIWQSPPALAFSIRHYNIAIQDLCCRLDGTTQSLELAVLASVVFSYIEFLLDLNNRVEMHIQAGSAILESLHTRHNRTLTASTQAGSNCQPGDLSTRCNLLTNAMAQLATQVKNSRAIAIEE